MVWVLPVATMPTKYKQLGVSLLLPSNKIDVKCRARADRTGQLAIQAEGLIWLHSDFSGLILVKLAWLCHQANAGSQFYWAHVNSWSFSFIFDLVYSWGQRGKNKIILLTKDSVCLYTSTVVKEIDYLFPEELNSLCITLECGGLCWIYSPRGIQQDILESTLFPGKYYSQC